MALERHPEQEEVTILTLWMRHRNVIHARIVRASVPFGVDVKPDNVAQNRFENGF